MNIFMNAKYFLYTEEFLTICPELTTIGLLAENGDKFLGECQYDNPNEWDSNCREWGREVSGSKPFVEFELLRWLYDFEDVCIWFDIKHCSPSPALNLTTFKSMFYNIFEYSNHLELDIMGLFDQTREDLHRSLDYGEDMNNENKSTNIFDGARLMMKWYKLRRG